MALPAAIGARYAVRPLAPPATEALSAALAHVGGGIDTLPEIARHGAAEALAVRGLEADESRILEREAERAGCHVLLSRDGGRAVLLGPLSAVAALPQRLMDFGRRSEGLGQAVAAALMGRSRGVRLVPAGRFTLETGHRSLVMGIVNVTPDSFSGDGLDPDQAVARGRALAAAGADLIDVGGESTRPHSAEVPEGEEMERVIPVIRELCASLPVPVCVDTRKAAVAAAALEAGADGVNDIWGLTGDAAMAGVLAGYPRTMVVAMHNRRGTTGGPDVVEDVCVGLWRSLEAAEAAGIDPDRVVVDPGFGFGKTPGQNLELVRRLGELRGIGRPLLLGASRKSTIGLLAAGGGGPPAAEERLAGSLALAVMGVAAGADLVRVHDVAETVQALRVADALVYGTPSALAAAPAPGPTQ